jgi:hypothetical protein
MKSLAQVERENAERTERHFEEVAEGLHEHAKNVAERALLAMREHGRYASDHEAYAVVLEELDEAWEEVRKKQGLRSADNLLREIYDTAAALLKWAQMVDDRRRGVRHG